MRLGGACALSSCAGDNTDPRLFQNLSYSGNLTVAVHQCITTSMRVRLASEIWFSWSRWAAACSRGMRTQPEAAVTASFESVACQYSRLVPKRPPAACFLNVDSETLQPFQRLNRGRPCGGRGTACNEARSPLNSMQVCCPGMPWQLPRCVPWLELSDLVPLPANVTGEGLLEASPSNKRCKSYVATQAHCLDGVALLCFPSCLLQGLR